MGILKLPIITHDNDFPVIQYADDTILLMQASMDQILVLKEFLQKFATSIGLCVNYRKSLLVPINVEASLTDDLARELGCQVGVMPFTYLGLPLGTSKPTMHDMLPLVECLERTLTSMSIFSLKVPDYNW